MDHVQWKTFVCCDLDLFVCLWQTCLLRSFVRLYLYYSHLENVEFFWSAISLNRPSSMAPSHRWRSRESLNMNAKQKVIMPYNFGCSKKFWSAVLVLCHTHTRARTQSKGWIKKEARFKWIAFKKSVLIWVRKTFHYYHVQYAGKGIEDVLEQRNMWLWKWFG